MIRVASDRWSNTVQRRKRMIAVFATFRAVEGGSVIEIARCSLTEASGLGARLIESRSFYDEANFDPLSERRRHRCNISIE